MSRRLRANWFSYPTNFRSHAGLTEEWNRIFDAVFGGNAAVPFSPSYASEPALLADALRIYPQVIYPKNGSSASLDEKDAAQKNEAQQVLEIVERHLPEIAQAQVSGHGVSRRRTRARAAASGENRTDASRARDSLSRS